VLINLSFLIAFCLKKREKASERPTTTKVAAFFCIFSTALEHFPIKWTPLDRKKMRPNKDLERRSDAIGSENTLTIYNACFTNKRHVRASAPVGQIHIKVELRHQRKGYLTNHIKDLSA
jgi:hypothetical protein